MLADVLIVIGLFVLVVGVFVMIWKYFVILAMIIIEVIRGGRQ